MQIRDFHIAEREEDIGYYAGFMGNITRLYVMLKVQCMYLLT